jgi:hypothetical protein
MLDADSGYIPHLVQAGLSQDEPWWRSALDVANLGRDTRDILEGYLPGFQIDPEKVLHVEERLYLDANLEPTKDAGAAIISCQPDIILLEGADAARIPDFKSQFRIVDASEFFQSQAYSLVVFQRYPFLREITFELAFVRYGNAKRSVTYTRSEHLEHLKKAVLKARQRQVELHQQAMSGNLEPPVGGSHCVGCPIRITTCPFVAINDYSMSPEKLTLFAEWAKGAYEYARGILKDLFLEDKAPQIVDPQGNVHQAGYTRRREREIALTDKAREIIHDWNLAHEKKQDLEGKMTIGGLSSYLKAKFRQPLLAQLEEAGCVSYSEYTVFDIKTLSPEEARALATEQDTERVLQESVKQLEANNGGER